MMDIVQKFIHLQVKEEKKLLANAMQILISELVLAGDMNLQEARRFIEEAV